MRTGIQQQNAGSPSDGPDQPKAPLLRKRFDDGLTAGSPFAQWAAVWKKMLLVQDGSATLICETLADGPVQLDVLHQQITADVLKRGQGASARKILYRAPGLHVAPGRSDDG